MSCERRSSGARGLIISLLALVSFAVLRADVIDDSASLQNVFDEALLDIHGERWSPAIGENLLRARRAVRLTSYCGRGSRPLERSAFSSAGWPASGSGGAGIHAGALAARRRPGNDRALSAPETSIQRGSGVRSSSCRSSPTLLRGPLRFSVLGEIPRSATK